MSEVIKIVVLAAPGTSQQSLKCRSDAKWVVYSNHTLWIWFFFLRFIIITSHWKHEKKRMCSALRRGVSDSYKNTKRTNPKGQGDCHPP